MSKGENSWHAINLTSMNFVLGKSWLKSPVFTPLQTAPTEMMNEVCSMVCLTASGLGSPVYIYAQNRVEDL